MTTNNSANIQGLTSGSQLGAVLISTQTASTSSVIEFTGLSSAYAQYMVSICMATPTAGPSTFLFQMGTSGTYATSGYTSLGMLLTAGAANITKYQTGSGNGISLDCGDGVASNQSGWFGTVFFSIPVNTGYQVFPTFQGTFQDGTYTTICNGGGSSVGSNINCARFAMSGTTIAVGSFSLYGMPA